MKRIYANWRLKCGENQWLKLTVVGETGPKGTAASNGPTVLGLDPIFFCTPSENANMQQGQIEIGNLDK